MTHPQIYDSRDKQIRSFYGSENKIINWYACGPTVYDESHLGHARTYIMTDVIRRILEKEMGYTVILGMNITDVDDKIIAVSNIENVDMKSITTKYEKSFFDDMDKLGVGRPNILLRATDSINDIIKYIEVLVHDDNAYVSNNSVYIKTDKYIEKYGKLPLCNQNIDDFAYDTSFQSEKKNPYDFVLWKKAKENEPSWDSPWGKGRPGWHIECSTMAFKMFQYLNEGYLDIHSGGIDLKFPHHNNEEVQSSMYLDGDNVKKWADFYLHIGHLNINGCKMSKSEKNFITIKECLKKYSGDVLRMYFLMHKYRDVMELNSDREAIEYASNVMKRLNDFMITVENHIISDKDEKFVLINSNAYKALAIAKTKVTNALYDDFDTPLVVKTIMQLMADIYQLNEDSKISIDVMSKVSDYISQTMNMLGFTFEKKDVSVTEYIQAIDKIRNEIRERAKQTKDGNLFSLSDKIRDVYMHDLGVQIRDK